MTDPKATAEMLTVATAQACDTDATNSDFTAGVCVMRNVTVDLLTPWLTEREASLTARITELEADKDAAERDHAEASDRAEQAEAALTELAEKLEGMKIRQPTSYGDQIYNEAISDALAAFPKESR